MATQGADDLTSVVRLLRSNMSSEDPEDIAETFVKFYRRFGDAFLDLVKKQKVFFRIHSIERGNAISKAMQGRLVAATKDGEISDGEARQILRFITEHRVIITPKIHIYNYLDKLPCWQIQREIALLELAAEIEARLRHLDLTVRKRIEERIEDPIARSQIVHSQSKSLLENGMIALREMFRRNPETSPRQTVRCKWDEILRLANAWRRIQVWEDRYVYFDWSLFVNSTEEFDLVVCRPKSFAFEGVLHFADYRANYFDQVALNTAQSKIDLAESEIAAQVHAAMGGGIDFDLLLNRMAPDIEKYIQTLRTGRRQAVEQSHLAVLTQFLPKLEARC